MQVGKPEPGHQIEGCAVLPAGDTDAFFRPVSLLLSRQGPGKSHAFLHVPVEVLVTNVHVEVSFAKMTMSGKPFCHLQTNAIGDINKLRMQQGKSEKIPK